MGYRAEVINGLVMVEEDRPVCVIRRRLMEDDFYDMIGKNPVIVADDTHHPFTHCVNGHIWVRMEETEDAVTVTEDKPKRKPRRKKVEA